MKNYIIKPGVRGMFDIDVENDKFDVVDYFSTGIDWTYLVPEDGDLTVVLDGENIKKSVKKNDIVVVFYKREYTKNRVIVIKNKEWKDNILAERKYDEDCRKEEVLKASVKASKPCCDCECCDSAN